MNFFRQTSKRTLFLWTLLLSIALLCAQGVKLHAHSLDHEQEHGHIGIQSTADHSQLGEIHLSTDVSHEDHHGEVAPEIDLSLYAFLNKVSSSVLTLALFVTLVTLLYTGFYRKTFYRRSNKVALIPWRYVNSPPLRAPPL